MGDMEDDFGDLYADVEVQVSSAFHAMSNFNKPCNEEDENHQGVSLSPSSDSSSKKGHSSSEELVSYDKEKGSIQENEKLALDDLETLGVEDIGLDNGSDSEDDLHIVLNEEDCRKYPVAHDGNGGNFGMGERSDEEEGEIERTSKDKKCVDRLQSDGLEQNSAGLIAERGAGVKGSYTPQYSQYKYIRAHAATVPSTLKASGAVPFPSPSLGRGDCDVNGSNTLIGSSSGVSASSFAAFPPSQNGRDFFLPRHRTIFDVNIDSFERKPWRHPGVDITDYFNFGFDEDSWKSYCNLLEQCRQKSNMLARSPYGTSRLQGCEVNFNHESVDSEVVAGEVSHSGNSNNGEKLLEMPKGRAIQVEGGIGERLPSMDIRRSRNRDSDVVIQISVPDPADSFPKLNQEEPGSADSSMLDLSENGGLVFDDNKAECIMAVKDGNSRRYDSVSVKDTEARPSTRSSERKTVRNPDLHGHPDNQEDEHSLDADKCRYRKAREYVSEKGRAVKVIEDTTERLSGSPTLSCLNSASESSKDEVNVDMDDQKMGDLVESDYHNKGFCEGERERESEDDHGNRISMQMKQKSSHKLRLRSVAELTIHAGDGESSPLSDEKGHYVGNHVIKVQGTQMGRKEDFDFNDPEELSYYRETEISIDYRSRKFTRKGPRNAISGTHHRKGYSPSRDEVYIRRSRDGRESSLDKRIAARDSELRHREDYLFERGHSNGRTRGVIHEESTRSTFEHASFSSDEERYRWQRRRSDDEHEFRKRRQDDKYFIEHSYKEDLYQEKYGRQIPYNDKERDYYEEKYDRHEPYIEHGIRGSNRSERYGGRSYFDLDESWNFEGNNDGRWRRPDHKSMSPYSYRECHISSGRGYRDTASPGNDLYDSKRLDDRSARHWRRLYSEEHINSSWFDSNCKDHWDEDIYPDDYSFSDRERHFRQSHWVQDEVNNRPQIRGRPGEEELPFSYEGSLRHESFHGKHNSFCDETYLDEDWLERDQMRMIGGRNRNFADKDELAALRSRDSVESHLVSWEGKSFGRYSEVEDSRCNGWNSNYHANHKRHRTFRHSDELNSRKLVPQFQKVERASRCHLDQNYDQGNKDTCEHLPVGKKNALVPRVRQLAVEEHAPAKKWVSKEVASNGDVKEDKVTPKEAVHEAKVGEGLDNQRILDTLAKMEKRRQRFEESTASRKEPDKHPMPPPDVMVEPTVTNNQQRPARKRRWGGS